ncbi:MAG: hypothetical protein IPL79_17005 [Myxococcales bacterium]|nr:hypothetical protein [Myxococcales bacterium]
MSFTARFPSRLTFASLLAIAACTSASDEPPPPPDDDIPACGSDVNAPLFTALPVDESAIDEVIVFGELDPGGGDVIPNGQSGIRLDGTGVELRAPADGFIVAVEKFTWLASEFREGESDFSLIFRPCDEATVSLQHVFTTTAALAALVEDADCETYDTESETIQACSAEGLAVPVTAGEVLGTVGGATAGGFDFDMSDTRREAVVTTRANPFYKHAVCFSSYYDGADRTLLESLTGLLGEMRSGDPACGTIEVDVAGSAQGVWVREDNVIPYDGGAHAYLTLAPDFLDPEAELLISIGGEELRPLHVVTRSFVGRANLDFASVPADDSIHCYAVPNDTRSVMLALSDDDTLTFELISHDLGQTPCSGAAEDWLFSGAAVTYVR